MFVDVRKIAKTKNGVCPSVRLFFYLSVCLTLSVRLHHSGAEDESPSGCEQAKTGGATRASGENFLQTLADLSSENPQKETRNDIVAKKQVARNGDRK